MNDETCQKHVLMIGMDQPVPPHGGTRLRLLHLARQTARFHDVTMLAMGEPPHEVDEPFALEGVEWGHGRVGALLGSVRHPYLQGRLHSDALARRVESFPADLVQVSSIYFVEAARRRHDVPIILDAHNVEVDIVRTQAGTDESALRRLRWRWETRTTDRVERAALAQVDAVLACSDLDAAHFEQYAKRVVLVPNGVDVAATPFRPLTADPSIAYLGMYSYRPNEVAALTLLRDVFPRVKAKLPDATLRLIGADPTPAMRAVDDPAIEVTGRVDDAVAELQRSRVLVISLQAGSGTRLKAIEAMAAGVVVISTSTGVAGLGAVDGEHVLIGDTPADLAAATLRVLTDDDLAQGLAERARRMVEGHFDWERCAEPMLEIQNQLLSRGRA